MEISSLKASEKERKKIISLDHIGTWHTYRHYEEQFTCELSKRFAEKQTINHWMYKPKVEFYHRYISSEPWPTDLKLKRAFSLHHIGTWQAYRHYEEQFKCEFSKRFAEKQTINHWMYKPKVEFYHRYISSEPWPTDLKIKRACLLPYGYIRAKFEVDRTKNDREINYWGFSYFASLLPWPLPYGPENE